MEIIGKLIVINKEVQISDKFCKREFVIETEDRYPQKIQMQLTQDRVDIIDPYKVGDGIKCYINLRGREWTSPQGETKYFNTIECWKIEGMPQTEGHINSEEEAANKKAYFDSLEKNKPEPRPTEPEDNMGLPF